LTDGGARTRVLVLTTYGLDGDVPRLALPAIGVKRVA
jgi:hypothetical protein